MATERLSRCLILNRELVKTTQCICVAEEKQPTLKKKTTQTQSRIVTISTFRIKYTRIALRKILKIRTKVQKEIELN